MSTKENNIDSIFASVERFIGSGLDNYSNALDEIDRQNINQFCFTLLLEVIFKQELSENRFLFEQSVGAFLARERLTEDQYDILCHMMWGSRTIIRQNLLDFEQN